MLRQRTLKRCRGRLIRGTGLTARDSRTMSRQFRCRSVISASPVISMYCAAKVAKVSLHTLMAGVMQGRDEDNTSLRVLGT